MNTVSFFLTFKTFGHSNCKYEVSIEGLLINYESSALFSSGDLLSNVLQQPFNLRRYLLSSASCIASVLQLLVNIFRDLLFLASATYRKYSLNTNNQQWILENEFNSWESGMKRFGGKLLKGKTKMHEAGARETADSCIVSSCVESDRSWLPE